jgi:peptide/nickel transport system permease protein
VSQAAATFSVDDAGPSARRLLLRRILGHKGLLISSALIVLIVVATVFAPLLTPYDPYAQNLPERLLPPLGFEGATWAHPLGTDNLGRDYLTRILYGGRISLLVGFAVMVLSCLIGTSLGLAAGYFGGRVDMAVSFLVTVRLALPLFLVALAIVALYGGSLTVVILVLGLLSWDRFAVIMRAATQQIRSLEYVAAAQCIGASHLRIMLTEILPNLLPQLIVVATLSASQAILAEAALSFLGLGVQPPLPSWGLMVADAKVYIFFMFWPIAIPGTAIALLVFAINMLGDGVRDVFAAGGRRD